MSGAPKGDPTVKTRNRNIDTTLHFSTSMLFVAVVALSMSACGEDFAPYEDPSARSETLTGDDLLTDPRSRPSRDDEAGTCSATCWCGTPSPDTGDPGCLRSALVGDWTGTMSNSHDRPGTSVRIEFLDEETYVARCPWFGDSGPGLCLEEDGVKVARAYTINDIGGDGSASGRIQSPEQESMSFIADLRLSTDGQRLTFEVWSPWNGREVRGTPFSLRRMNSDVEVP